MNEDRDIPSAQALLTADPVVVYKDDRRSRVWSVRCGQRFWVIKRFEHNRLRQILSTCVGLHPAQTESRRAKQLTRDGLPVVPLVKRGMTAGRGWIVTPRVGRSLQIAIADGILRDRKTADRVITAAAGLVGGLIRSGWYFRDLQVANLVLSDDGKIWMIDVGGSRRSTSVNHKIHMLAMLGRSARIEGMSRTDLLRGLNKILERVPSLGSRREVIDQVLRDPGSSDDHGRGL